MFQTPVPLLYRSASPQMLQHTGGNIVQPTVLNPMAAANTQAQNPLSASNPDLQALIGAFKKQGDNPLAQQGLPTPQVTPLQGNPLPSDASVLASAGAGGSSIWPSWLTGMFNRGA